MINILIIINMIVLTLLEFYKDLITYQQNQYIIKRYFITIRRKLRIVSLPALLLFVPIYFIRNNIIVLLLMFVVVLIAIVVEYNKHYKVSFKVTARMKRICALIVILTVLAVVFIPIKYVIIVPLFSSLIFPIFHVIMLPIEMGIRNSFRNKARKKLEKMNIDVVGITGSYGKTSSKNILNDIIKNNKYSLPTPASYNTPMGLSISINNDLTPLYEVFIAEMGAYKIGEIKECCDVVSPNIAIITSIGKAHLESFGSQDNILKGKFELVESLPPNGLAVLNADDELMMSYKIKNKCNVKTYSIDLESDLQAYNLITTTNGVSFSVDVDGKSYFIRTKLLGKHNVYNILSCIVVALYLDIDMESIVKSIANVAVIPHRLELRKSLGATIIDDAFNSNPVGAREAAYTLGQMDGYRVAMTPGMIELGDDEFFLNKEFGKQLSENADLIYIVGKSRAKPFVEAFEEANFENYLVVNTVDEGFKRFFALKEQNKILLIENDLTDIY